MSGESGAIQGSRFLVLSITGLAVLAILTFFTAPPASASPLQRPIAGLVFVLICASGTLAAIYPSRCSNVIGGGRKIKEENSPPSIEQKALVSMSGHHPNCGKFLAHTFQIGDKLYCAGCTGLVIGALVSIIGTVGYLVIVPQIGTTSTLIFCLGFFAVCLALLQHILLKVRRNHAHLLLSIGFVIGDFLILIAVMEMNNSIFVEAYFLTLTVLLILTRVILSQMEHERVCRECNLNDCGLR